MKQCAFLTLDVRGDFVIDDEHAVQPLADLGWQVSIVSWRQREIPWSHYDAVIIRSTWDYWNDVDGFLEVLQTIDASTRLANSLQLVRWNLAKTYLWLQAVMLSSEKAKERAQAEKMLAAVMRVIPQSWLHDLDREVEDHFTQVNDSSLNR